MQDSNSDYQAEISAPLAFRTLVSAPRVLQTSTCTYEVGKENTGRRMWRCQKQFDT